MIENAGVTAFHPLFVPHSPTPMLHLGRSGSARDAERSAQPAVSAHVLPVRTPDVSRCDAGCVSIYQKFQVPSKKAVMRVRLLQEFEAVDEVKIVDLGVEVPQHRYVVEATGANGGHVTHGPVRLNLLAISLAI